MESKPQAPPRPQPMFQLHCVLVDGSGRGEGGGGGGAVSEIIQRRDLGQFVSPPGPPAASGMLLLDVGERKTPTKSDLFAVGGRKDASPPPTITLP